MKLVTGSQMARIESRAASDYGISADTLMEEAGLAVADHCWLQLTNPQAGDYGDLSVLVLVGPGNNGGDGLVAARHLSRRGAEVTVYFTSPGRTRHPKRRRLPKSVSIQGADSDPDLAVLRSLLMDSRMVIDAILGTGQSRAISHPLSDQLMAVSKAKSMPPELTIVAVDVPTGVNADTGAVDKSAVAADFTIALGRPKICHFTLPGSEICGDIAFGDIGILDDLDNDVTIDLMLGRWAARRLPERPASAHKGSFGKLLVVAGSRSYVGAAHLAAVGASRVGTGLVTCAAPESIQMGIATAAPHVTHLPLPETRDGHIAPEGASAILRAAQGYDALVVGCGIGQSDGVREMLVSLLRAGPILPPTVLDADALNVLSETPNWHIGLKTPLVLTPHPGEMTRLTGLGSAATGSARISWAREAAFGWDQTVVLKGPYTVVAGPDGKAMVAPFANPVLATAGTGDVLAGAIGGLLAQGMSPMDAAALGVFIHGSAGDTVREHLGDAGAIAGDLLEELPLAIRQLAGN